MNSSVEKDQQEDTKTFCEQVDKKAKRRIKARMERAHNIWFGLGVMGIVGWSVAIPMLACVALGIYLDTTWSGSGITWTLILLFVGITLGCLNAWYWIKQENERE